MRILSTRHPGRQVHGVDRTCPGGLVRRFTPDRTGCSGRACLLRPTDGPPTSFGATHSTRGAPQTELHIRKAARYWQWRVAAWPQDREADVHDLREALPSAPRWRQRRNERDRVCLFRSSTSKARGMTGRLIAEQLGVLPADHPRMPAWIHQLRDPSPRPAATTPPPKPLPAIPDHRQAARQPGRQGLATSSHQLGILLGPRRTPPPDRQSHSVRAKPAAGPAWPPATQLGILAQARGDYAQAETRSSNPHHRGSAGPAATSYHQLGILAQARGGHTAETHASNPLLHRRAARQPGRHGHQLHQLGISSPRPAAATPPPAHFTSNPHHRQAARQPGRHAAPATTSSDPRPGPRRLRHRRDPLPAIPHHQGGSATRPAHGHQLPPARDLARSPRRLRHPRRDPLPAILASTSGSAAGPGAGRSYRNGDHAQDRGDYAAEARWSAIPITAKERLGKPWPAWPPSYRQLSGSSAGPSVELRHRARPYQQSLAIDRAARQPGRHGHQLLTSSGSSAGPRRLRHRRGPLPAIPSPSGRLGNQAGMATSYGQLRDPRPGPANYATAEAR